MSTFYCCAFVIGCAFAAACGATPLSPTAPTSSSGQFGGTWLPMVTIDSCTGTLTCIGYTHDWFALRLVQHGSVVTGSAYVGGRVFDVNAAVRANGELVIQTPPVATFSLDELSLHPADTGLTGTLRYTEAPMIVRAHVTSAKRGPLESTQVDVHGTWVGNSIARVCTFTLSPQCPLPARPFRLSLTQSGSMVSGNLDPSFEERFRVPVAGRFAASTLTLDGSATLESGQLQLHLITWNSHADSLGRMMGSFVLDEETILPDRRSTFHSESDLQDVYLLPDWFMVNTTSTRVPALARLLLRKPYPILAH